jgi:hypothetical protein
MEGTLLLKPNLALTQAEQAEFKFQWIQRCGTSWHKNKPTVGEAP